MKGSSCKAKVFPLEDQDALRAEIASSDIFTNGTGVGMKPLEGLSVIEDTSMLRPDLIVTDVVYNPVTSKVQYSNAMAPCQSIMPRPLMVLQPAA